MTEITYPATIPKNEQKIERNGKIIVDAIMRGTIKYAFYDPPWTLPIMRRNEVMAEIE